MERFNSFTARLIATPVSQRLLSEEFLISFCGVMWYVALLVATFATCHH
jgi:hypothetical protein